MAIVITCGGHIHRTPRSTNHAVNSSNQPPNICGRQSQWRTRLKRANEFPTEAYKLEFNAPAKTYLKIVAQRNDGAKYMVVLPPAYSDDINARTKIDRTTTLATKIFEIITKNSKSEDQKAITAVAKNTLAVHDLVQMARGIDSSMTEQKKSQTSSDNAFMNILASFAVKESNKLFDSIVSGGESSDLVQKNLSNSAYKTMFGTLAQTISPGILAHRVNDNYNSVDVAYTALIETWKIAPNSMYPVVSAFQLEATAFRTANTAESAAESEATVKSRYETAFPNCFSTSSTTLGSCVDLGYAPPLPPSN